MSTGNDSFRRLRACRSGAWVAVLVCTVALPASGIAGADPAHTTPRIAGLDVKTTATMDCARLKTENFRDLPEAPAAILSTHVVAATASIGEYCDVSGYIQPQIQFELRLPTKTWNGRYLQGGCGGFCGTIFIDLCADALAKDFVIAAENMGHVSDFLNDPLWGSDPQLRRDFGQRSAHVVALAAKAIIARFYDARPAYSYFRGCSTGGREALSEAQFFPEDFDGIIAGDPAFAGRLGIANTWVAQQLFTASGGHVISDAKIALLHAAVLKQCDARDGLADGIISDPQNCHLDVGSLVCAAGQDGTNCLTATEAHAVQELYAGPHDRHGQRLYPGGVAFGSELAWYQWIIPSLAEGYLRYLAFETSRPPNYSYREFDFDRDVVKVEAAAREYDPVAPHAAPDLRGFERRGGKLIAYEGWADPGVSPFDILDYYGQVTHRQGGLARVSEWFRLYLVPGMYHCGGGNVPDQFDTLAAITSWVEKKSAPDRILATQFNTERKALRSRPLFPYPTMARYTGRGDVNDAQNWAPSKPKVIRDDRAKWVWGPSE